MIHKHALSTLLVGAAFFTMAGCRISPPAPPTTPLTQSQFSQVSDCQAAITKESLDFTEILHKKLNLCLDNVIDLQLRLENGLMTQAQYDVALEKERKKCARAYALIGIASTNLIDGIDYFCKPIENLILGPDDPLQFRVFDDEVIDNMEPSITETEDIGGLICGMKTVSQLYTYSVQVPRFCHVLETLGPGFFLENGGACVPTFAFFLDPRCEVTGVPGVS